MGTAGLWFVAIAALFLGFFVLEGFDFGVGMLMEPLGRVGERRPRTRTRAPCSTPSARSGTATRCG